MNYALKSKGLRHFSLFALVVRKQFELRPEIKGIETSTDFCIASRAAGLNYALKSKGLRPLRFLAFRLERMFELRPEIKGIETLASLQAWHRQ